MSALELLEDVVTIGSTVVVRDLETHDVDIYTIVTPPHADISRNRISSLTPVAHALYGRRAGETVDVSAPAGAVQLRIESIHHELDGEGKDYG